jgi:hypothetical protein
MSLLANQTNINTSTTFFLESGGESTVPVFTPITQVSNITITANQKTINALVPIPDKYSLGDTVIFQTTLNLAGFSNATTVGIYEFSVAFSNDDDESSGNQTYIPINLISSGVPTFRLTLQLTDVIRSSAINVAIRVRNTNSVEAVTVSQIQFLRTSFQFICSNSI